MKTNNQTKSKNKKIILIIWGFFISFVMIVLLTLLLLKLQKSPENQKEPEVDNKQEPQKEELKQQEQQTYNSLLKKIETEVDKLTNDNKQQTTQEEDQQPNTLKYPPDTTFQFDGGKIVCEFNQDTGKIIKSTHYNSDSTIRRVD
ncbi:MAG: DUF2963 domain-containing protein [Candidatus Phytoplasma sp. TWB_XP]